MSNGDKWIPLKKYWEKLYVRIQHLGIVEFGFLRGERWEKHRIERTDRIRAGTVLEEKEK
ncbi:hypothetical protein GCM10008983_11850 [Lentibacillus halophilus]|uniref:Uncharacterized protein n=1 Tax=Lentibacillus halophilus TaxID=295065 RepID=A0ABN0Z784_9BACI